MPNSQIAKLYASLGNHHGRTKSPFFLAEGLRLCREALTRRPQWVQKLFIQNTIAQMPGAAEIANLARLNGIHAEVADGKLFKDLTETETTQGILCVLKRPDYTMPTAVPVPFALILDRVADPGNMGTILRTAWAAGIASVWLVKGCADPFAPKVVRSGMGAQFALEFSQFESLKAARDTLFNLGGKILWCTEEKAEITVFDEKNFLMEGNGIVLGNEANGISDSSLGTPVTIPMPGHAESLNVAQAATVFIFEYIRRSFGRQP